MVPYTVERTMNCRTGYTEINWNKRLNLAVKAYTWLVEERGRGGEESGGDTCARMGSAGVPSRFKSATKHVEEIALQNMDVAIGEPNVPQNPNNEIKDASDEVPASMGKACEHPAATRGAARHQLTLTQHPHSPCVRGTAL